MRAQQTKARCKQTEKEGVLQSETKMEALEEKRTILSFDCIAALVYYCFLLYPHARYFDGV